MQHYPELPEEFEGTDEEKLRLQIDLLKLKLQAELGGDIISSPDADLPPEVELKFLEQIFQFHEQDQKNPAVPLRDYLKNPCFPPSSDLSPEELEIEWQHVQELYDEKGIGVDFLAQYPLSVRYDFMTKELLDEEVKPMPGWRFIYEEFHPNHDYDQRKLTEEFMKGFFEGEFNWFYMSKLVLTDEYNQISLEEAQKLLERFHGMFEEIKDWDFRIFDVSAQCDEEVPEGGNRLGFAEGAIKYTGVHHDGSAQQIHGPFKLYMECNYDCWHVVHFFMHGFSWR